MKFDLHNPEDIRTILQMSNLDIIRIINQQLDVTEEAIRLMHRQHDQLDRMQIKTNLSTIGSNND